MPVAVGGAALLVLALVVSLISGVRARAAAQEAGLSMRAAREAAVEAGAEAPPPLEALSAADAIQEHGLTAFSSSDFKDAHTFFEDARAGYERAGEEAIRRRTTWLTHSREQATAARSVVAFMLPLLCGMDIVSLILYRRDGCWKAIAPLVPGTLLGVALASMLFVSDTGALIAISDRVLKGFIGSIGIIFVVFQMTKRWILGRIVTLEGTTQPGKTRSAILGLAAGVLSTISHSAGPAAIIYFVPQQLGKLGLAGTMVAFFLAHRRLWVTLRPVGDKVGIMIAGNAHRNQPAFAIWFDELKDKLKDELS